MDTQKILKSFKVRWFLLRIMVKKVVVSNQSPSFETIDKLRCNISDKKSIVVLCSGPSAIKLEPKDEDFYLVTNDSYKLVKRFSFLYYVNDGYFFRKFVSNTPLCKNHVETLFFFRKEDKLHRRSFEYFKTVANLLKNNNYMISNFDSTFKESNQNYHHFFSTLKEFNIPIKIQNSGIFLLLFGFYLATTYDKELVIYGLDLGDGGKVHFDKSGHVGKSVTSDRVKVNTKLQLEIIYNALGSKVRNHSNFNPN